MLLFRGGKAKKWLEADIVVIVSIDKSVHNMEADSIPM
jgi:hypothetical protein